MLRRAPSPTLFPYTTLFRSASVRPARAGAFGVRVVPGALRFLADLVEESAVSCLGHPRHPLRDRKSTRLNSSHTVISYAVVCLKKKNVRTPEEMVAIL